MGCRATGLEAARCLWAILRQLPKDAVLLLWRGTWPQCRGDAGARWFLSFLGARHLLLSGVVRKQQYPRAGFR